MNRYVISWILPRNSVRFTSTSRHAMDELAWSSMGSSSRFANRTLSALVVSGGDDGPIELPEPVLPTPTDVPVPEPHDVPVPEPKDIPPPDPHDLPPGRTNLPEITPELRSTQRVNQERRR